MKFPGILPLTFFVILVPALIPVLERFWPSSTVWWSAILVTVLGALLSAIRLVYRAQLSKAGVAPPAAAAVPMDGDDYTFNAKTPQSPSALRTWFLG